MNPFTAITNLFEPKDEGSSEAAKKWARACRAFEKGKAHYMADENGDTLATRMQKALDCFDEAIADGFEGGGIYASRGSCLQTLEFHLDAIDEFNKAIALSPEDSNLYFMRSVSKGATGDLPGQVTDLQDAIRVSTIENESNKMYHQWAQELGYKDITAKYEFDLLHAKVAIEEREEEERMRVKCAVKNVSAQPVAPRLTMTWRRVQPSSPA